MNQRDAVIFPAGTPVLIIGFPDKSWEYLEAFAFNHQVRPKILECGKLAEPFHAGSSLLLEHGGSVVGIKPMPEDRVVLLETRSEDRMVSVKRKVPDEFGNEHYLVIEDKRHFIRDLNSCRGFMSGYEERARIEGQVTDEFKRIFLDLPIRYF